MNQEEKDKYYAANKAKYAEDLSLAKIDVIRTDKISFLSPTLFRSDPRFRSDLPIATACADGKNIFVDIEFWSKLKRSQKFRAIFHEGFHNMMGHCNTRVNTKTNRLLWNIAADSVTEAIATQCGVGEGNYVEGVICPTNDGTVNLEINGKKIIISQCQNRSVEDIYSKLVQHVKENPKRKGQPGDIDIRDGNGKVIIEFDSHDLREFTAEEQAQVEQQLREALVKHKLKGTMPGGLADVIEQMLKGKVNWKAELRAAILPEIRAFQTYRRPNKRLSGQQFVRPSMVKEGILVDIAFDTSGSMGTKELNYSVGEVQSMFKQFDPGIVKARLMLHHSEVYSTMKLEDVKDLKHIQTKSGGTSHMGVFKQAEENKANVLVCFTDGYSDFPETTKIKNIIWICTDEKGMERIPENLGRRKFVDISDLSDD